LRGAIALNDLGANANPKNAFGTYEVDSLRVPTQCAK